MHIALRLITDVRSIGDDCIAVSNLTDIGEYLLYKSKQR